MDRGVHRHPDEDAVQHPAQDRAQQRGRRLEQAGHGAGTLDPAVPVDVERAVRGPPLQAPGVRDPGELVERQLEQVGERGEVGQLRHRPAAYAHRATDGRDPHDPDAPNRAARPARRARPARSRSSTNRASAYGRSAGADRWAPTTAAATRGSQRCRRPRAAAPASTSPGTVHASAARKAQARPAGQRLVRVVGHAGPTGGCGGGAGRPVLHERVPTCAKRSRAPADLLRGGPAAARGNLGHRSRRSGLEFSPTSPTTADCDPSWTDGQALLVPAMALLGGT